MVEEASDKFGAEMVYFERNKVADFTRFLDEWICARVDFHTQAARHWQDLRYTLQRAADASTESSSLYSSLWIFASVVCFSSSSVCACK
jgi:hypothetical protein